ncbi:hypothetical protein CAEBREN_22202 [Caenorhabditis brenneri]|uniref:DUF19 domain-containing protein n=1 Tax=Caenorhabditis brenneri TaxID=135651 RepID=G0NBV2_CAEBE|nr:hypothetical protein CAEBREN_22202 [Caenorhabditis brenneri]
MGKLMIFVFCFLHLLHPALSATKWPSFTDSQIMELLPRICPAKNLLCPSPRYSKETYVWDEVKVLSSEAVATFKSGKIKREDTYRFFKKEFCCDEPQCLKLCGIFKKEEIGLVKDFPGNVRKIFSLKLDGLEKFRQNVEKYLRHSNNTSSRGYPAEIEDYFDFIAKHEDRILSLLGKSKNE